MSEMKTLTVNGKSYTLSDEVARQQIGQLISAVDRAAAQAPAIVCQSSGTVLAVDDSANRPLRGLKLFGKTVQGADPSPAAPQPLYSVGGSGSVGLTVAGKNLLNIANLRYVAGIGINRESSIFASVNSIERGTHYMPCLPNTTYTFSKSIGSMLYLASSADIPAMYVPVTTFMHSEKVATITTGENDRYICFSLMASGELGTLTYEQILATCQLELGDTATEYEPYKPQTLTAPTPNGLPGIPVATGGNYTDENGQQWICDEIDLARGVHIRRIGSLNISGWKLSSGFNVGTSELFEANEQATEAKADGYTIALMCDKFCHNGVSLVDTQGLTIGYRHVYARIPGVTDANTFNDLVGKATLLYSVATPIETALDTATLAAYAALHTNKPATTVLNDAGAHMELSYVADTKAYIDRRLGL